MATSESDGDFESADEELSRGTSRKKNIQTTYWTSPSVVDSESDDDTDYIQRPPVGSSNLKARSEAFLMTATNVATGQEISAGDKNDKDDSLVEIKRNVHTNKSLHCIEEMSDSQQDKSFIPIEERQSVSSKILIATDNDKNSAVENSNSLKSDDTIPKVTTVKAQKSSSSSQKQGTDVSHRFAKKPGTRITKDDDSELQVRDNVSTDIETKPAQEDECLVEDSNKELLCSKDKDTERTLQGKSEKQSENSQQKSTGIDDLSEIDMPEELKSNKRFREVFEFDGWEGLDDDIDLPDELTEDKLRSVFDKPSSANKEPEEPSGSWGSWGNWGITSLINTASASVSTLTDHVSQGLTLLENTIGVPDPELDEKIQNTREQDNVAANDGAESPSHKDRYQSYSSFGFGNLMSGVSSITKLVESTSNKVMTGGLDTLEAIGKKTMAVLQDGDPGLKKKKAFFMNEANKPILSQILREAKEKAETEEKTIEERELARKIHFESLFDDYQGLVHLEALELLSKQSNMKIEQTLIGLDTCDLVSIQETLDEVKDLCDLDDEDEADEDSKNDKDLKNRLEEACHDFSIDISYEKLHNICIEAESYLTSSSTYTDQEIFQKAISTLAQFTALSVERFHKTAELLLIKEGHSTINEAYGLVQVTNLLSNQVTSLANLFCDTLSRFADTSEKPDNINTNKTKIFLEAANANSYIQDAFRLLIPIVQVGAI